MSVYKYNIIIALEAMKLPMRVWTLETGKIFSTRIQNETLESVNSSWLLRTQMNIGTLVLLTRASGCEINK